ncbi:MAG: cytochrome c3 family protein [Planctomycetota bacterium]|nr:MAG: cytochrome c3 family protein [Planctomycetota bacterium]
MKYRSFVGITMVALGLVPACREGEQQGERSEVDTQIVESQQQVNPETRPAEEEDEQFALLGANAGCYVCHMMFVDEELSAVHLEAKVGCVDCHGTSAGHANDENVGATPPDKIVSGEEINQFCRICHETHDVEPEKMVARWQERSKGKPTTQPSQQVITCTQCHGEHRIGESG